MGKRGHWGASPLWEIGPARRKESGLAAGFDCWSVPDVPAIDRIASLDGDVVALLLALLGQLLGVVLECFLQGDVAGVGLGDFVAVSGLGVRVVRQVLELLGRALSRGGKDFVDDRRSSRWSSCWTRWSGR